MATRREVEVKHAGGPTGPVNIRDGSEQDMEAVQRIYAHHVTTGLATFEETPPSTDELATRRASVLEFGLPYLVATRDDEVLGYSYATPYRARPAYRYTVEDSVYLDHAHTGQGIGRLLLTELIARCEAGRWRQMIGIVGDSGNTASIALHRKMGFELVGTLEAVGFKFGRWVDTVVLQRALSDGSHTLPDKP